ncbi:14-3-3 protein zeta [Thelohanellus kitauei]|uniref:14-3-3 protein zeta n=1 Tax=Thelohanellus kitauei TaxID=669202 RepID=A0A0C2M5K0_THEKT|nr:14-3-3 protein zeta [Thelohanellus kitauei]
MSEDKSKLIAKTKLAEQAERYDDMCSLMKTIVESSNEALTNEERNLLSVAYKNVVGARRASWRAVSAQCLKTADDEARHTISCEYKESIKSELVEKCMEVLDIIKTCQKRVSPDNPEEIVFYLKMEGDYYRYIAEVHGSLKDQDASELSFKAYEAAMVIAKERLKKSNSVRLGLALNFSVYFYEIKNDSVNACATAKEAFDEAIEELEDLQEDSYKDSTLIMQLLRDNLALWNDTTAEGGEVVQ